MYVHKLGIQYTETLQDTELWVEDGDCYVHLYAQGASRRGPSLCIPFRALRQKKCSNILNVCHAQIASRDGTETQPLLSMSSSLILSSREPGVVNLYIPAPDSVSREDAFKWHITTRNFFAFLLGKPLVGFHMGQTFVDLQERLQIFRNRLITNHEDFFQYAEDQGYRDFAECTDYALASLYYAESQYIGCPICEHTLTLRRPSQSLTVRVIPDHRCTLSTAIGFEKLSHSQLIVY